MKPINLDQHEVRALDEDRLSLIVRKLDPQPLLAQPFFVKPSTGQEFINYEEQGAIGEGVIPIPYAIGDRLSAGELDCTKYSPDIQAMGDCIKCGNTYESHARFTLTVTNIRVIRVRELSEVDAISYGIDPVPYALLHEGELPSGLLGLYRGRVRKIYEDTYGPDAWDRNEWCAFYTVTSEKGES